MGLCKASCQLLDKMTESKLAFPYSQTQTGSLHHSLSGPGTDEAANGTEHTIEWAPCTLLHLCMGSQQKFSHQQLCSCLMPGNKRHILYCISMYADLLQATKQTLAQSYRLLLPEVAWEAARCARQPHTLTCCVCFAATHHFYHAAAVVCCGCMPSGWRSLLGHSARCSSSAPGKLQQMWKAW